MNCKSCGADLTRRNAVKRTYTNKDGVDKSSDRSGLGHYEDGEYEPDGMVYLEDGRYDLVDGSDTCVDCGEVLG